MQSSNEYSRTGAETCRGGVSFQFLQSAYSSGQCIHLSTIKKLRRVRYHPKPKRTSEQAMSATRAIYSFCAASIILFETNRISPAFFFTIDCEAKNVNYKKTPSFPNAGSESGDWYPTSAPGMLVLVSFLDFFCSPLKRLASSLVAVLVSEWCSM